MIFDYQIWLQVDEKEGFYKLLISLALMFLNFSRKKLRSISKNMEKTNCCSLNGFALKL